MSKSESFHIVTFRHKGYGGCTLFWGPNKAGYTTDIRKAGVYGKDDSPSNGTDDVLVPVEFFNECTGTLTFAPESQGNQDLKTGRALKAALRSKGML